MKILLAIAVAFCLAVSVVAQGLPNGFTDSIVVPGLSSPTAIAFAPDGRMFICEKDGAVKIFKNGSLLGSPFLNLSVSTESERGVLGIAFDPNFTTNNFVYIYYTTNSGSLNPPQTPKNRVSRFTASGDTAAPGSEVILLDNIPSDAGNHNAGCLRFGLDGNLYIATGDGGQNHANSQSLTNTAGKILRINSDGSIPTDNPFYNTTNAKKEIYLLGLRNPFRFSFKPNTNTMYIGDVGENTWEELNVGQKGGNYGWNVTEGTSSDQRFVNPIFTYQHTNQQSGAITGGCFITSRDWPAGYINTYFYGDYVRSIIGRVVISSSDTAVSASIFAPNAPGPVDFAMRTTGPLYYVDIFNGAVHGISYDAPLTSVTTANASVTGGNSVTGTAHLGLVAPAAGKIVQLSSSSSYATVPATVIVASGATSSNFTINTTSPPSTVTATVTAKASGVTKTASLTINPGAAAPPKLVSIKFSPSTIPGGGYSRGVLSFVGTSTSPITINLSRSTTSIQIPATTTLPAGETHAYFNLTSSNVSAEKIATVSGTAAGVTKSGSITLTAAATILSLTVNPTSVVGGADVTGTVRLTKPAPAGGFTVTISGSASYFTYPATVTVNAGYLTKTFVIHTKPVSSNRSATVSATNDTVTRSAAINLNSG